MSKLQCCYLGEPDLIFGFQGEEKDPRLGIKRFGPYFSKSEGAPSPSQVRLGIIGSGETITLAKQIVEMISRNVPSSEPNRWLYPDYPGFTHDTRISCEIITADRWNVPMTQVEIKGVLQVADVNERIAAASSLIVDKLQSVAMEEDHPSVVICALPELIEEYCGISKQTRGAKRPRFTALEEARAEMREKNQSFLTDWGFDFADDTQEPQRDYDLHNSIKGKSMRLGIPTQVLRESTMKSILEYPNSSYPSRQSPATFSWNLSMALYYKANGRPWRLAKLTPGTCYVGISFYKNLRDPKLNVESSMAQVFTHSGEGFVLRGTDVIVDEKSKEPHLSARQSEQLMREVVEKYTMKVHAGPSRVVIHKSTRFATEEEKGFRNGIGQVPTDFVAISEYTPIRLLRVGDYPVLRGTLVLISPREYLLFTGGYTPRLRTYPGHRVPEPLHIVHFGDSDARTVCNEILGLTKLNWNTTSFSTYNPITLEFADRVGKVLSELPEGTPTQDHYRFYM